MKTTKTCGDHLTDLIATRLTRFITMKKKIFLEWFWKKITRSSGANVWIFKESA